MCEAFFEDKWFPGVILSQRASLAPRNPNVSLLAMVNGVDGESITVTFMGYGNTEVVG